jgi:cytochrome c oxidase subunit III
MTAQTAVEQPGVVRAPRALAGTLLGMVLFITSEAMFFGTLFGAYFTLRADSPTWPPNGTPELDIVRTAVFTAFLVASSFTQHRGVRGIRKGDVGGLVRWTLVTIVFGVIFGLGQAFEYASLIDEGFSLPTNIFATLFFTMTGFHGLHVIAGLAMLTIVIVGAKRGHYSVESHGPTEAVGYYWHFVDVVWVFLFSVLYLLT